MIMKTILQYSLSLLIIFVISNIFELHAQTPDDVINKLKEGNARYVNDQRTYPNLNQERRTETAENGQHPYATIITCSDSRVPVENIFDAGIGDIFVIRVAGNVINKNEAGSVEYGVDHLHTPVFVVLGHTHCGAVTAAATNAEVHGNIPHLLESIEPSVEKAKNELDTDNENELIPLSVKMNIWQSIEDLFEKSHTSTELVNEGKLKVVGAIYHIEDGKVEWLGEHPNQNELLENKNH